MRILKLKNWCVKRKIKPVRVKYLNCAIRFVIGLITGMTERYVSTNAIIIEKHIAFNVSIILLTKFPIKSGSEITESSVFPTVIGPGIRPLTKNCQHKRAIIASTIIIIISVRFGTVASGSKIGIFNLYPYDR